MQLSNKLNNTQVASTYLLFNISDTFFYALGVHA